MSIKTRLKNNRFIMRCYNKLLPYYCRFFTKSAVKMLYKQTFQKPLDLKNPKDLNEKINWLKVYKYKKDPLVIQCADKWAMREYVKEKGYPDILNEVYYVYDSHKDINWELLPKKFALKFNKAAGMNIICRDKSVLDKEETLSKVAAWFKAECGERFCELHYRKASSKVICERYLGDGDKVLPIDYKVHCFNGEPILTMVCIERDSNVKFIFVDNEYKQQNINSNVHGGGILPPCPPNFSRMLEIARDLAKPFPLVRVDFYDIEGKLYIGEMTFTPQGGYIDYISQEGLNQLGDLLVLPEK